MDSIPLPIYVIKVVVPRIIFVGQHWAMPRCYTSKVGRPQVGAAMATQVRGAMATQVQRHKGKAVRSLLGSRAIREVFSVPIATQEFSDDFRILRAPTRCSRGLRASLKTFYGTRDCS